MLAYNVGRTRPSNLLGGDDDRISELRDEVVVSILSRLPLKEAAATSILSRRWWYTWMSTVALNFDSEFDVSNPFDNFYNKLSPEEQDQRRLRYIDWVNHVVEQHTGSTIERFRVCFDMNSHFSSSIDKWIQFAMNRRVQILELDFYQPFFANQEHYYTFLPKELLGLDIGRFASQLQHSDHPEITTLRPCRYSFGFRFLKVLSLQYVSITGEVLEYFLSNCHVLERLSIFGANNNLYNLRVVGPSIALKYLTIDWCESLNRIEIRDAKLCSFSYRGLATTLLISNVPLLVEVSISEVPARYLKFSDKYHECWCYRLIELPLTQLSCCLSHLEILELDIKGAVYDENRAVPTLLNLKHLKLIVKADYYRNLYLLTSLMKACPYLQRLILEVNDTHIMDWTLIQEVVNFPHYHLKVVEILGYRPLPCIIQHVMFLIRSIAGLEKLIIDPVESRDPRCARVTGIEALKEEDEARDSVMRYLKRKVPSTVEFVCL